VCVVQAKALVLTHFSGRVYSGQVAASAADADNEDEQQRSLMALRAEAKAGLRQGFGSTGKGAGSTDVTVACAFDGFTWRLASEPAENTAVGPGKTARSLPGMHLRSDEDWVKKGSLVGEDHGR
jgi:hypothetical protein